MGYRQLTQIHVRYDLGMSQRQIAREIGVNSSTVSRELRRNAIASGYDPEQAQSRSDHRRRTAWKWTKRLPSMISASLSSAASTVPRPRARGSARLPKISAETKSRGF